MTIHTLPAPVINDAPAESFVIPCRNDAGMLMDCLKTLMVLEPPPQLVVAHASNDGEQVRRICDMHGAHFIHLKRSCCGAQLDAGAAVSGRDVLVFHHADSEIITVSL